MVIFGSVYKAEIVQSGVYDGLPFQYQKRLKKTTELRRQIKDDKPWRKPPLYGTDEVWIFQGDAWKVLYRSQISVVRKIALALQETRCLLFLIVSRKLQTWRFSV